MIQFDEHIFQMGWNHQLEKDCGYTKLRMILYSKIDISKPGMITPSLKITVSTWKMGGVFILYIYIWIYGGFLKWCYPTTMGFLTKNDHFGVFWGYPYFWNPPYLYTHRFFSFFVFENLFLDFISLFEEKNGFHDAAGASADALHLLKISVGIARDEALGISPFFSRGFFCGSSMKTGGFTIGDPLKFPLSLVFLMFFCFEMIWKAQKTSKVLERKRPGGWKEKASPKKVAPFWAILWGIWLGGSSHHFPSHTIHGWLAYLPYMNGLIFMRSW